MRVLLTTNEDDLAFLTQQAQPINPNSENLQLLADRMLTTVNDPKTRGVGIAAPQVGISRQAFLVKRLDKINAPFELFINPKITWYSDVKRYGQEGCLSIPDQTGKVYRSLVIQIEYCDLEGNEHKEVIEGYTAVICQHEYDHLNGVLFLDQIERSEGFNYAKSETKNALYYELLPPTP
ncbi:peptide deformylase [Flavobacterium agricola]|uniref:Peptide deformylase n=2 Tax=Flavobacterium agricola TaxID=2870839 RepID=A0ABY6M249_9FLAO|nr:peptide deformylase [Flavobacterium agricola]